MTNRLFPRYFIALFTLVLFRTRMSAATVWLGDLNLGATILGWGEPSKTNPMKFPV